MLRAKIQVTMDERDFGYLFSESLPWAAQMGEWQQHIARGRFEGEGCNTTWARAYWVEGGYPAVMLARAFLDAFGHGYEVIIDTAEPVQWMILTDYEWEPKP